MRDSSIFQLAFKNTRYYLALESVGFNEKRLAWYPEVYIPFHVISQISNMVFPHPGISWTTVNFFQQLLCNVWTAIFSSPTCGGGKTFCTYFPCLDTEKYFSTHFKCGEKYFSSHYTCWRRQVEKWIASTSPPSYSLLKTWSAFTYWDPQHINIEKIAHDAKLSQLSAKCNKTREVGMPLRAVNLRISHHSILKFCARIYIYI